MSMNYPGRFNFIQYSKFFLTVSVILTVVGLTVIFKKGFRLGIDFAGGREVQIQFQNQKPDLPAVRAFLKESAFTSSSVQSFGSDNEILIRMEEAHPDKLEGFSQKLKQKWPQIKIRRVDSVGPQIGNELKRKGFLAVCYALLLILIYLGLRFNYNYAPSAVFCLIHDSVLTMTIVSLFDREVNVQTLAAILAIIGYSLNDTIVTFDRIRENHLLYSKKETFAQVCNRSLNDVLSRTLLTSITTLIAVSSMWFLTEGVIKDFAFTLGFGIIIGTISSIYAAVPLTLFLHQIKNKKFKFME